MIVKLKEVRRVDLTAAAEQRLLERALACGGGVVQTQTDRTALERQMVEVVALLAAIDDALAVPAIIQDVVPRAN